MRCFSLESEINVFRIPKIEFNKKISFRSFLLKIMTQIVIPLLGIRVTHEGEFPKSGAYIIAANHTSHFDTAAIIASMDSASRDRLKIAASSKYFFKSKSILKRFAINLFSLIPASGKEFSKSCLKMRNGNESLLIYPEGTRSRDGEIHRFMSGVGAIHRRSSIPIIPVSIIGTNNVMAVGRCMPKSGSVKVIIGKPICIDTLDSGEIARTVEGLVKSQFLKEVKHG